MCLKDLIEELKRRYEIQATDGQIRWAINSGKIARPPLDGSLRFDFNEDHLSQLRAWLLQKDEVTACT